MKRNRERLNDLTFSKYIKNIFDVDIEIINNVHVTFKSNKQYHYGFDSDGNRIEEIKKELLPLVVESEIRYNSLDNIFYKFYVHKVEFFIESALTETFEVRRVVNEPADMQVEPPGMGFICINPNTKEEFVIVLNADNTVRQYRTESDKIDHVTLYYPNEEAKISY